MVSKYHTHTNFTYIAERQCYSKGFDAEKVKKLKQEWISNWCQTKNKKYLDKATLVQNMEHDAMEELDIWEDTYQKVLKGIYTYLHTPIYILAMKDVKSNQTNSKLSSPEFCKMVASQILKEVEKEKEEEKNEQEKVEETSEESD